MVSTGGPFNAGGEWSWPAELAVSMSGKSVVVTSERPRRHSPDLRALTILEAAQERPEVLAVGASLESVELRLGKGWRGPGVARLLRRLGLFPAEVRSRIRVRLDEKEIPVSDSFGGALGQELSGDWRGEVTHEGDGLELIAGGLDDWFDEVDRRHEGANGDRPPLPSLRLIPRRQAMHPRAGWILARVRSRGMRVDAPERSLARRDVGFVARLTDAVTDYKERVLRIPECGTFYGTPYPHILPPARWKEAVWRPLQKRTDAIFGRQRHGMFHNLKSSQAFAVNVLLGLEHDGALNRALERALLFERGRIERSTITLEFCPPHMKTFLGESGQHQTQVDAHIRLELSDGRVEALLLEVKLTELDFGACRGPFVATNQRVDVCGSNSRDRASACYVAAKGRTYLNHLAAVAPLPELLGSEFCPLRDGGYQLARNLLVARWLEGTRGPVPASLRADRARFCVLSARETPALTSATLRRVDPTAGPPALERLGVGWMDARVLVEKAEASPELTQYLQERYRPVFG